MKSPVIQIHRSQPVNDESTAATLLEAFVCAVSGIVPIEKVLWDYGGPKGVSGFDLARAMGRAKRLTGLGDLLGWIVMGCSGDWSIELGVTLMAEKSDEGSACVFFLKLPDGAYQINRLAEWCGLLLDSVSGNRGLVWDDDGPILQSSEGSSAADADQVISCGVHTFALTGPEQRNV